MAASLIAKLNLDKSSSKKTSSSSSAEERKARPMAGENSGKDPLAAFDNAPNQFAMLAKIQEIGGEETALAFGEYVKQLTPTEIRFSTLVFFRASLPHSDGNLAKFLHEFVTGFTRHLPPPPALVDNSKLLSSGSSPEIKEFRHIAGQLAKNFPEFLSVCQFSPADTDDFLRIMVTVARGITVKYYDQKKSDKARRAEEAEALKAEAEEIAAARELVREQKAKAAKAAKPANP
jgi:hypothetical protein